MGRFDLNIKYIVQLWIYQIFASGTSASLWNNSIIFMHFSCHTLASELDPGLDTNELYFKMDQCNSKAIPCISNHLPHINEKQVNCTFKLIGYVTETGFLRNRASSELNTKNWKQVIPGELCISPCPGVITFPLVANAHSTSHVGWFSGYTCDLAILFVTLEIWSSQKK